MLTLVLWLCLPYFKICNVLESNAFFSKAIKSVIGIEPPSKELKQGFEYLVLRFQNNFSIDSKWLHLIIAISNRLFASITTKTLWMPNTTHATQISFMANLCVAASTDPENNFGQQMGQVTFELSKIQQI